MLLWCLALGGLLLAFGFVSADQRAPAVAGFVLAVLCPGFAEAYAQRRRRSDWFRRQFRSREEFVRTLDAEGLRRVRDEQGPAEAVRELRRVHPRVPLTIAAETVRQL